MTLCAITLCGITACDRPPSDQGLPEWTASDHDRNEEQQRVANGQQAPTSAAQAIQASRGDGGGAADPLATLLDVTWRNQCSPCHGPSGRGDGPNGPMVRAANLADPDFQKQHTDAELTASIVNGKGRMPKFDLPPQVVAGLVRRVRIFGSMR
jgi:cytochrome c oxidase cbb3-type subunit 3